VNKRVASLLVWARPCEGKLCELVHDFGFDVEPIELLGHGRFFFINQTSEIFGCGDN